MLRLDPETGTEWIADSEEDLGPEAVIIDREPFKPGVLRLHVVWSWPENADKSFGLVYLAGVPC